MKYGQPLPAVDVEEIREVARQYAKQDQVAQRAAARIVRCDAPARSRRRPATGSCQIPAPRLRGEARP